jgi:hypothetical protein
MFAISAVSEFVYRTGNFTRRERPITSSLFMSHCEVLALQREVRRRIPFGKKLVLALIFVRDHPQPAVVNRVGVCWFSDTKFFCNSQTFGAFLNRKPNSVNFNFRTHQIRKIQGGDAASKRGFSDPRQWKLRHHAQDLLTKVTTAADAEQICKYLQPLPKVQRPALILSWDSFDPTNVDRWEDEGGDWADLF